jgi:cation diffusion facilitator CzcD-associated flavoprotein CzcO
MPSATFTQLPAERRQHLEEMVDFQKMNQLRARVDEIVRDRATAEALKPSYRYMCKRPTFSDTYLETFNRPNVTLVDAADHGGVRRVTHNAVVVGGNEYEVDCIIFATGFDVGISGVLSDRLSVPGRGGVTLAQYWYGEGPLAFHTLLHQWRLTGMDDVLVDATQ